ncbi:MAG TPA: alpha/beta hydrolase [Verrucomicrobiae bacterium]|nr:alpha/beta hydrolase [Verrucomicrobiae bacterium]
MGEKLQLRIYGDASLPALIYLPGLHGDWTIIGSFRAAIAGKVRFVEMIYPRTLTWSLDDYAAAIEAALLENGISSGWLLGESFGSQPVWAMVERFNENSSGQKLQIDGIILAGGFVRVPTFWILRWADAIAGKIALSLLTQIIFPATNKIFAQCYKKWSHRRFRRSPQTLEKINEFLERRTPLDFQAARHRLHLVAQNDPRDMAKNIRAPVFALTGWFDPIIPWYFVRRWLQKNCAGFREFKIISGGDHAVLMTKPRESAEQILKWMRSFTIRN